MPDISNFSFLTRLLINKLMDRPEILEMSITTSIDFQTEESTPTDRSPASKNVPDFLPDRTPEPTNDNLIKEEPCTEELQRMYLEHCFRSSLD